MYYTQLMHNFCQSVVDTPNLWFTIKRHPDKTAELKLLTGYDYDHAEEVHINSGEFEDLHLITDFRIEIVSAQEMLVGEVSELIKNLEDGVELKGVYVRPFQSIWEDTVKECLQASGHNCESEPFDKLLTYVR